MKDHIVAMFVLHITTIVLFVLVTLGITAIANRESRSTALLAGSVAFILELPLFGSLTLIVYC